MFAKIKQLIANTSIFMVGTLTVKIIQIGLMALYTSTMTADVYGTAELIFNGTELLYPLVSLSIFDAIFRFSIKKEIDPGRLFSNGLWIMVLVNAPLLAITVIIQQFIHYTYTWYIVAIVASAEIYYLIAHFARGLGKIKIFAIAGILNAVSLLASNLLLLRVFSFGIAGYLTSLVICNTVSILFLVFTVKLWRFISLKEFNTGVCKSLLQYCLPLIPVSLSWWIANISSRYFVNFMMGAAIAGLFVAASKLPSIINLVATVFQRAWQISTSEEIDAADGSGFFTTVFKGYSALILTFTSFLVATIPFTSKILLKGDFYQAWVFAPGLLVSTAISCYSRYFGTFYLALKRTGMLMYSMLTGIAVSIPVLFLLIPRIGVFGAIVANIINHLIAAIMRFLHVRKWVKSDVDLRYNIICAAALFIQSALMSFQGTINIVISAIIFIGITAYTAADNKVYMKRSIALIRRSLDRKPMS